MSEIQEGLVKPIVYVGAVAGDSHRLLVVDYKDAPNPSKKGWWIPSPGLNYGENPQKAASDILKEFGLEAAHLKLKDVESSGQHLIYHFVALTDELPIEHPNIESFRWISRREAESMEDFAHGGWEKEVAKGYLDFAIQ